MASDLGPEKFDSSNDCTPRSNSLAGNTNFEQYGLALSLRQVYTKVQPCNLLKQKNRKQFLYSNRLQKYFNPKFDHDTGSEYCHLYIKTLFTDVKLQCIII